MNTSSYESKRGSAIGAPFLGKSDRRSLLLLAASGLGASACSMTQSLVTMPKGTIDVHTRKADGTETHYHKDVENFDDVKEVASDAAHAAGEVTDLLIEKLTEVPPPGNVTLASLSPQFAQMDGTKTDYISLAKAKEPSKFQYVQIGVAGYDAFFKACAEFYAFVYQSTEFLLDLQATLSGMAKGALTGEMKLAERLDATILVATADLKAELEWERSAAIQIATLVPGFIERGMNVVSAAKQLVDDSQNALNAPQLVAHVNLIVEGVQASTGMAIESGKLIGQTSAEFAGFA